MTIAPLPNDQEASGRSFGLEELENLVAVLRSGSLTSTKGSMVKNLEQSFTEMLARVGHGTAASVVACASGSAAVHTPLAVIDPEPGDEVVTTSITDIGALTPIIYQGAVPVFADVDPTCGNVTAASVEAAISDRTRAVVVTHLFGRPADMDGILAVCDARGIPVVEDSAQAWLARSKGRPVGTLGRFGAFSLQQGKHVTSGEGGLVVARDEADAKAARTWVNKSWPYGEPNPDHRQIALNYRLTELQGAVALAQLTRLEAGVAHRVAMADRLTERLAGVEGITTPTTLPGDDPAYWRYTLLVDPAEVPGGPNAVAAALKESGVPSSPRYIVKPAFRTEVFVNQKTFGSSRWPFTLARPEAVDYREELFPGTFRYLETVLVLGWNERYTTEHVDELADAIVGAVKVARDAA